MMQSRKRRATKQKDEEDALVDEELQKIMDLKNKKL